MIPFSRGRKRGLEKLISFPVNVQQGGDRGTLKPPDHKGSAHVTLLSLPWEKEKEGES